MTGFTASLSKNEDGLGAVQAATVPMMTRLRKQLTRAEFDSGIVAAERGRIVGNSAGIFQNGEDLCSIFGEVGYRTWSLASGGTDAQNAAASHARTVNIGNGISFLLGTDSSVCKAVTGTPTGGFAGDGAVNYTAGIYWMNLAGVWVNRGSILPAMTIVPVTSATTLYADLHGIQAGALVTFTGASANLTLATDAAAAAANHLPWTPGNGVEVSTLDGSAGVPTIVTPDGKSITGSTTKPIGANCKAAGSWDVVTTDPSAVVAGAAVTSGTLAQFAPTTSAQLLGVISDETGTGQLVFGTAPTISNANLTGAPAAPTAAPGTNTTQIATMAALQAAVAALGVGMRLKGLLDASAGPNYPAGTAGDVYFISPAGKVGGTSGKAVDASDMLICNTTAAAGAEAAVGASWFVVEHNLIGALVAANNGSDILNTATFWANLGGDAKAQTAFQALIAAGNVTSTDLHYSTWASFQTAVAAEQARVAASNAKWEDGARRHVGVAPNTITMIWSVANNHARLASFGSGKALLLGADNSVVNFGTGAPGAGVGANGDGYVDWAVGAYGQKAAGAWPSTPAISFASSGAVVPTVTLAVQNAAPTVVEFNFSQAMYQGSIPAANSLSVTRNGSPWSVSSFAWNTAMKAIAVMGSAMGLGDTGLVTFAEGIGPRMVTLAGNAPLASFAAATIGNNVLTVTNPITQATGAQNWKFSNTSQLRAGLAAVQAGTSDMRLLVLGDSYGAGYGAGGNANLGNARAGSWVTQLAAQLNTGSIPASAAYTVGDGDNLSDSINNLLGYDSRLSQTGASILNGYYTLGGIVSGMVSVTGSGNSFTFTPGGTFNQVVLMFASNTTTQGSFDLLANGILVQTISNSASIAVSKVAVTVPNGTTSVTLRGNTGYLNNILIGARDTTVKKVDVINACASGGAAFQAARPAVTGTLNADAWNTRAALPVLLDSSVRNVVLITGFWYNDRSNSRSIAQAVADLGTLIADCKALGADVIYGNYPALDTAAIDSTTYRTWADAMLGAARDTYDLPIFDMSAILPSYAAGNSAGYYYNNLHLNAAGHILCAQSWKACFDSLGATATDTQVSDRFNRLDNTANLGSATTGQAYTASGGTFGVAGQRGYPTAWSSGDAKALFDSGLSDLDISIDMIAQSGNGGALLFRGVDANNFWCVQLAVSSNIVNLWQCVAGSYTNKGTFNLTGQASVTTLIRAVASGTAIAVYLNGATTANISTTSSQFQTATLVGFSNSIAVPNAQFYNSLLVKPVGAATARRIATWNGDKYSPRILAADTAALRVFQGWANPSKEGVTLAAGDRWQRGPSGAPVPIIFDTDCSTDVDDLMVMKQLCVYSKEGRASITGVVVSTSKAPAPGALAAVCQYYGQAGVSFASYAPLGSFDPASATGTVDYIYANYPHTGVGAASTVTDSSTALTNWLTASSGGITYVVTGFAKALVTWLKASAGNAALFASKVTKIVALAGLYPSGTEFNLANNYADWSYLQANPPVPITWVDANIGGTMGNIGAAYLDSRQPTSEILHAAIINYAGGTGVGRPAWDMIAMHYAVEGGARHNFATVAGTNNISATDGTHTFTAGSGPDKYLTVPAAYGPLKYHLESLLAADVVAGTLTWNGSAWA